MCLDVRTFIYFILMKVVPIKRVSTLFLKAVLVVFGLIAAAICIFALPNIWNGAPLEWPGLTETLYLGLTGVYLTIIPFIFALYQAFKLLQYIDKNAAFSEPSIAALRNIKFSAVAMTILYALALPLAFVVADNDDAPGLILFATAFAGSPLIIATFAAVLQKLVQNAVDMKAENDLTV